MAVLDTIIPQKREYEWKRKERQADRQVTVSGLDSNLIIVITASRRAGKSFLPSITSPVLQILADDSLIHYFEFLLWPATTTLATRN